MYPDYDSPIDTITQLASDAIVEKIDKMIHDEMIKEALKITVNVDKDKLQRALEQDKDRYKDAFYKGYSAGKNDICRCENCYYYMKKSNFCTEWNSDTCSNGYCHKALKSAQLTDEIEENNAK
jgi:hypothetical protein